MHGKYTLQLNSGGELIIQNDEWYIVYYFPGPDRRYNGTVKVIISSEIDEYIDAWKNNFKKYQALKTALPTGGTYNEVGERGMDISVGGYVEGVGLHYSHRVSTQEAIDEIIADYKNAKETAKKLIEAFKNL